MEKRVRNALRLRLPSRLTALGLGLASGMLPAMALAAEEEGPSGIAALGFNLPGLVAQLINFAILLVVLRLFLFGPVVRLLDERKARIQEGLQQAEQAAAQVFASEEQSARVLAEARAEGQAAIQRAQESAARLREDLEARARADAEQIVTRAREEIALERDQAIQQFRASGLMVCAQSRAAAASDNSP